MGSLGSKMGSVDNGRTVDRDLINQHLLCLGQKLKRLYWRKTLKKYFGKFTKLFIQPTLPQTFPFYPPPP